MTQHAATCEQVADGVEEPNPFYKERIRELITLPGDFDDEELERRCVHLLLLIQELGAKEVMIGGLPAMMPILEHTFRSEGITVCYAQSERISKDIPQKDGSVRKVAVFRHLGLLRREPY